MLKQITMASVFASFAFSGLTNLAQAAPSCTSKRPLCHATNDCRYPSSCNEITSAMKSWESAMENKWDEIGGEGKTGKRGYGKCAKYWAAEERARLWKLNHYMETLRASKPKGC